MRILLLAGFIVHFFFHSCVSKKEIIFMQDIDQIEHSNVRYIDNTIQPNDILKITVGALTPEASLPYNRPVSNSLNNNNIDLLKLEGYLIGPDLILHFPILGNIDIKGKTPKELENHLINLLVEGNHLSNPTVTVRLLNAKVTILGEVNRAGTYTFTENNITLLQALGLAGDLTINGQREDVVIIREVDGNRTVAHIDLTQSDWLNSEFNSIRPNDVIVVNPNSAKVKSAGFIGNAATVLTIFSIVLSTTILLTR